VNGCGASRSRLYDPACRTTAGPNGSTSENQINAAFIFARSDFVNVRRVKKQLVFKAAIFVKQKTNTAEQERSPDCQSH
jgi:hypothetical protein